MITPEEYYASIRAAEKFLRGDFSSLIEDTKEADAFFPEYEKLFTKKVSEEPREYEGLQYRWVTLEK